MELGGEISVGDRGGTDRLRQEEGRGMSTPIIRDIARTDYVQWLPLWDGYNHFYGRCGPTALSDEITATSWARFFDEMEPVHCLVAEQDGRLIGLTHYLFHRSTTAIGPICYLQD